MRHVSDEELLCVQGLRKSYLARRGSMDWLARRKSNEITAVDDVSFSVRKGEIMGIVGESGSGKTTLARCLIGLERPDAGRIVFAGRDVLTPESIRWLRKQMQIVFQDPYGALNPKLTIGAAIAEVFRVHRTAECHSIESAVDSLLDLVGLSQALKHRRPRELSGGQRQRAVIARALAVRPRLLLADEPVSALDASVQAQILNLLLDLCDELELTIVFISHQLSVVSYICDTVAVMHQGQFVEAGPVEATYSTPKHPYTKKLLAAHPTLTPSSRVSPVRSPSSR